MAFKKRSQAIGGRAAPLLAHPFQHAVAGMFVVSGGNMAWSVWRGLDIGFASLPIAIVIVWIVMILLGGIGILAAATRPLNDVLGREIERASLFLTTATWSSLVGTVLFLYHLEGLATFLQCALIVAACLGRLYVLGRVNRVIERVHKGDTP